MKLSLRLLNQEPQRSELKLSITVQCKALNYSSTLNVLSAVKY